MLSKDMVFILLSFYSNMREKKEKRTILDFEIKIFILPLLLSEECVQSKEQFKKQDADFQTHVFPTHPPTHK